jgi:hypothetical protein
MVLRCFIRPRLFLKDTIYFMLPSGRITALCLIGAKPYLYYFNKINQMKLKYTLAAFIVAATLVACNNDDATLNDISGTGTLNVEFDNAFGNDDLILNSQTYTTSQNEALKISTVKYIISNIVLTSEDGAEFVYPKSESYFIVNEGDEDTHVLALTDFPAGNYTKIKFGIGVDQEQYNAGTEGSFFGQAQAEGLLDSWDAGYTFLDFEGTFTSPAITTATPFRVKPAQAATVYNYTEVTLTMPTPALVRQNITPEIHIITDVSKFTGGTNAISFTENSTITDGALVPLVLANVRGAFSVNHVHNDQD